MFVNSLPSPTNLVAVTVPKDLIFPDAKSPPIPGSFASFVAQEPDSLICLA